MTQSLFVLKPTIDDPNFESFAFDSDVLPSLLGRKSFLEDLDPEFSLENSQSVPSLLENWKPLNVSGNVISTSDYPMVYPYPAFSQRAAEILRDLLSPQGELLELTTKIGTYFLFHIRSVQDILDSANSEINFEYGSLRKSLDIDHFALKKELDSLCPIFRIPQLSREVFVNEQFVNRVAETKLNGFEFYKVWPIPSDCIWRQNRIDVLNNHVIDTEDQTKNSVILVFKTKANEPSVVEWKRIEKIEQELESFLGSSRRGEHLGQLEGHDFNSESIRVFLSCPNASKLADELLPWSSTLKWWPTKVEILQKSSHYMEHESFNINSVCSIDQELLSQINSSIEEGHVFLDSALDTPYDVIHNLDEWLIKFQEGLIEVDEETLDSLPIMLGTVWGQQIVNDLNWCWFEVGRDDYEGATLAVMPQDQSLAIYPLIYLESVIFEKQNSKVMLSFELLRSGEIKSEKSHARTDVMSKIIRIVPA